MLKYLLTSLLFSLTLWATPSEIILNQESNIYSDFEILYYEDSTNSLNIDEISLKKFVNKSSNRFSFGYKKTHYGLS